jgi:primase-polymerase (primpol)-like protein
VTTTAAREIPLGLRERDQWVVWRYEQRHGKRTKVPYQASRPHERASTTDPQTWASFDESSAVQGVDGIGYVLSAEDPFTGIDLDHCIDESGEVHPAAAEIIGQWFCSYTEQTPSGRGFHIFIEARLPGGGRRTRKTAWGGELEIYDQARFFTVTGDGSGAICPRQAELDTWIAAVFPLPEPPKSPPRTNGHLPVDDRELLEKAFAEAARAVPRRHDQPQRR